MAHDEHESPIGNQVQGLAQQGQLQPVVIVGDTIRVDLSRMKMGVMEPFSNGTVNMWIIMRTNTQFELIVPGLGAGN